jgi:hypothetical protein
MYKRISVLTIALVTGILAKAQTENSPYSRYGLGDIVPSQNTLSRGMGGVSAAYYDFQSVNFINPASYSKLKVTTLDFGVDINSRTLRTVDPPSKFNGISPQISYLQLGIPLSTKKNWGMNFGLRPMTRINYRIERNSRLPDIDSVNTLFEGNGGAYQVHVGTGVGLGNFNIGVNIGYLFGSKNYSTKTTFVPDSAFRFYYRSNHATRTNFGGLFMNAGVQYLTRLNKTTLLHLGAYGNLEQKINATRDVVRETFTTDQNGDQRIDSVFEELDVAGKLQYPVSYGLGFMLVKTDRWSFGMDYTASQWSNYRLFDQGDLVQDSWKLHVGGQVVPNVANPKSYWGRVAYRAGFQYGKDYIKVDKDLPVWTFSLGAGLPMRKAAYTNQFTVINTAFEFGRRGNQDNPLSESFFRLSVGLTLSDLWFLKRKYD